MSSRLRIIVTGLIAQYPLGGMTWHYLQYLLGLRRLGHDVYYLEHSGSWPYNPLEQAVVVRDSSYNIGYLKRVMAHFGFAERWGYFSEIDSRWFGMPDQQRREVVTSADALINVSGSIARPQQYRAVERLVYIDTDPVFTQIKLAKRNSGNARIADFASRVDAHDVHFSFGERVAETMPDTGHRWLPTRQPIVLDEWANALGPRQTFTTVMNWTSYSSESWNDDTYGQKDIEFPAFLELPRRAGAADFEIAGAPGVSHPTPRELLAGHGWRFVDPMQVGYDFESYRRYIQTSRGEWSVAKNAYVRGRSGWFSERSACYLAAGRPVILQDTGFSAVLPVGEGILSFQSLDEAVAAVEDVQAAYPRHVAAARAIAESYFESGRVLESLLARATQHVEGTCRAVT